MSSARNKIVLVLLRLELGRKNLICEKMLRVLERGETSLMNRILGTY